MVSGGTGVSGGCVATGSGKSGVGSRSGGLGGIMPDRGSSKMLIVNVVADASSSQSPCDERSVLSPLTLPSASFI
jgi:hypothetical protein